MGVPRRLLSTTTGSRIIFFINTKISFGPPSGLPSCRRLTAGLTRRTSRPLPRGNRRLSHFVKVLPSGFGTRGQAGSLVHNSSVRYGSARRTVIELTDDMGAPHVIAAGCSLLLRRTTRGRGYSLNEDCCKPTIPVNDSFSKLLCLRNSISDPSQRVILSSESFTQTCLSRN